MQARPALVLVMMLMSVTGIAACKRPAVPGDVPNPVPAPSSSSVGESSAGYSESLRELRSRERATSRDEVFVEETLYTVVTFDRSRGTPRARVVRTAIEIKNDNRRQTSKFSDPMTVKF